MAYKEASSQDEAMLSGVGTQVGGASSLEPRSLCRKCPKKFKLWLSNCVMSASGAGWISASASGACVELCSVSVVVRRTDVRKTH